ncbi:MAG TPA: carboxypeptidase-like regulatory domain-containing protein, partial [Candidatus Dormibacteraeota bacterium]|nr:carboxypeptidase-like regulatory domain-containing protein [Candidatus Dormibacteraeota bacterium]
MVQSNIAHKACLLAALTMSFGVCLYGQGGGNAAVTGTVTDPSGAVVVDAKVTIIQQATSGQRSTT